MEVVGTLAALTVIAYAASRIAAGEMTLGDFSAFALSAYAIYNPLKRINKFNLVLQQAVVAAKRVFEVIDAPAAVVDRPDAVPLEKLEEGIRFEGVAFAYPRGREVLRDFDLHLPHRSTLALVGASGAGKSTVAQLIPRFFDVGRGRVRVGAHDVRDLELKSLRAGIGLVTQENLLFNDSIRSNIVCGRRGFSDEDVVAAARAADAEEFIRALPDGFGTVIGEGGVKLSGGQRQRLALARAVLAKPPLLILDEATSNLDAESEARVQQALEEFLPGVTVLIITHRLAAIRRADVIALLEAGRLSESGSHEELVAFGGSYRRMVETQEIS
jgi:subfamily B ATP-binding cassette protein MsbA